MSSITPGVRITLRGEDFLVTDCQKDIVEAEGITELVKGKKFTFDLRLEAYDVIAPENTVLVEDKSPGYRQTKLFIETTLRNSSFYSDAIEIADKAAIRAANYQFVPTIKALQLPKPRLLIADAVGLGKTVEVGIFMAELIRRGKGQRILVVTPKSILAQFQQEIWARFAIPLVRLDSQGIARIKADIPSNKNPFEYYDKVIVSIDTLKNNGKFRHFLEKVQWDIVAIDECHTVANVKSDRGSLAKFLSARCEAMVLTSATPHNGKKENFANLMRLLDPTSIPYDGNFTHEDIQPLYVRRFKKDVEDEVGDAFRDRITEKITCDLQSDEEAVLEIIENFKREAYTVSEGNLGYGALLFSIGLFKAYMSSPMACLATIRRRLEKESDDESVTALLKDLKERLEKIVATRRDAKYLALKQQLYALNWKGGSKDERIIIFSERRDTLNELEKNLKKDFSLAKEAVIQFNGSLSDRQQQEIIEDFSKEDSKVRLFLASDAGSQGVNLHYHCNRMINYDVPWSIITLDQRNGRIDRFGQTETPYIYYLIARSTNKKVQGDIRILEKLKEKEEEVHKSLGDAGSVWKLFDENEETKKVTEAIAKSDETILDDVKDAPEQETDWLDVFGFKEEEVKAEIKAVTIDAGFTSFYKDDFSYYSTLVDEIIDREEGLAKRFIREPEDKILEITQGNDLSRNGVLYDIPSEAFPPKKEMFRLTTKSELVEAAIVKARKKKGDWPAFQLLYDLHPIARWMQFKLLAKIDKGKAPVARMRQPLPDQSAWFVFQGITSNGQGKPILAKTFVVSRSFSGQSIPNREDFAEFVEDFRLLDALPTLEVTETHKGQLMQMLPDAVEIAKKLYKSKLQGDLEDEVEDKLKKYMDNLIEWTTASEKQLKIQFGDEEKGILRNHKDKRRKEVQYVQDQMGRFYKEFFQLENEPFLRLLAVFYNA